MTQYISTRDQAPVLGFSDVTLAGLAVDGGLYVPQALPAVDINALRGKSYADTAFAVISAFVGRDIPASDLRRMIDESCAVFDDPSVAPLHKLDEDFFVQELFHGPTLAFKDVALQFLGRAFDHILKLKKKNAVVLGATSGDTGSAAIESFRDRENTRIVILHPKGRVSEVQRRQMTTVLSANVFNVAIEGSFDDCQDIVKGMFNDQPFRDSLGLSAVNSINFARILAQIVYYIYAALAVSEKNGKTAHFCVPTGNFGNVYAGYLARKLGAPMGKLIVATNANDILHRFFLSGEMKTGGVHPTLSPSMDIQVSSNFERLLFEMLDRDGGDVDAEMKKFRASGSFGVDAARMAGLKSGFESARCDDIETLGVMGRVWKEKSYLLDPHTAVGFSAAEKFRAANPGAAVVTLGTAHPAKFPEAVYRATGVTPPLPLRMSDLMSRAERYTVLPADLAAVKDFVRRSAA